MAKWLKAQARGNKNGLYQNIAETHYIEIAKRIGGDSQNQNNREKRYSNNLTPCFNQLIQHKSAVADSFIIV